MTDMDRFDLSFGATSPTLGEQLREYGLKIDPMALSRFQKIADGITLASIHGILTMAETHRARRRLVKAIAKDVRR